MKGIRLLLMSFAAIAVCSLSLHAASPKGWFLAGSRPADYASGIDPLAVHEFRPSAYLKSTKPVLQGGFGTLMQQFSAEHYLGKRIRFSALVKTEDAQDWAGLWMRVDNGPKMLAFDNMQDRQIRGTTNWRRYDVILDVPANATGIFFGVLLSGSGEVWLNDAQIQAVDHDVMPTGTKTSDEPVNLDFRE